VAQFTRILETDTMRIQQIIIQEHLTLADKILIGCLLLLALGSYPAIRFAIVTGEGDTVRIEVDGNEFANVRLQDEQTLLVPGPLGKTEVVIRDHEVFVHDSPCRAKICVKTGHVSQAGQMIVCVPNKVVVRVLGKQELPYDAISR
jgi:hypothetical protein